MPEKYTFRCRMCNLLLFDESVVIHPDHSCFSSCKNYVGSRDNDVDKEITGDSSSLHRFGDRYESTPKNFYRVYPKRQSEENAEWEDIDGNACVDEPQLQHNAEATDFTVDTSRKGPPTYMKTCTSIFLCDESEESSLEEGSFRENLSQLISAATQRREMAGVIDCPQCAKSKRSTRLGKFAICGAQCSCSKWITPALQFVSSKIDIRQISQLE